MMLKVLKSEMAGSLAVVVFSALALMFATPNSAEAFAICEFSVGPDHATCCECEEGGGDCEETEDDGVASCTFEFCSTTPCTVGGS